MKLEVVVTDVSQCKRDLTVEIAAEEVKAQFDKAYDAYSRHVKVPGFRPGRVPRGVIKQRFSKEVKEEVVGQLLPHALEHAIVDNKLRMVGEPHINELSVTEGEPLKFKASIEVIPEVELKEYKGLKITKRVQRVTDEDVERMIERWRENAAELVPVEDRPSQNGDFVTVNLVGKYVQAEGQTAPAHEQEDLKAEDVVIELGGVGVQPEFNENLHGVKADDVVVLPYPDYGVKLYGNAIIASPKMIKDNPAAVRAFLKAFAKGAKDVMANPAAAIDTVKARDGIINVPLETRRLQLAIDTVIASPDARTEGFGQIKAPRLSLMASQVSDAFNTKTRVNPDTIWNGSFLPAAAELNVLPAAKK